MNLRALLLLLLLLCVLLMTVDAARGRGRGRGRARGQRQGQGRGRGRGRGQARPRRRRPGAGSQGRTPVYLSLPGSEPIPIYPLSGGGGEAFTVTLATPQQEGASPALAEPPAPFGASDSAPPFGAGDAAAAFEAAAPSGSFEPSSRPFDSPGSDSDSDSDSGGFPASFGAGFGGSFGDGFFESGGDFGAALPRFPDLSAAFEEGVASRRSRRLSEPAEPAEPGAEPDLIPAAVPVPPHRTDGNSHDNILAGPSPAYEYGYLVDGIESGPAFGLEQSADGQLTRGRYEVKLPDGRTQVVTYTAGGKQGYVADVKYLGEAETGETYGY